MTPIVKEGSPVFSVAERVTGFQYGRLTDIAFQGCEGIHVDIIEVTVILFVECSAAGQGYIQGCLIAECMKVIQSQI